MTQALKLLAKFKRNPESIKYVELEKILISIGFKKIKTKGSHVKFKKESLNFDIVIPVHNMDCKNFYKKQVYKQIKKYL